MSGPRGSKRNIGNVLAGYLTNCYKLRRAFSRPAESAASYIPLSTPPRSRTGGLVLAFVEWTIQWWPHGVPICPWYRDGTHPNFDRCPSAGCSATSSGRWNRAGRGNWKKNLDRLTISSLSKARSTMIPVERCLLAGAPISLSHGGLAATANSYRFIDAERIHRRCGPFHFKPRELVAVIVLF